MLGAEQKREAKQRNNNATSGHLLGACYIPALDMLSGLSTQFHCGWWEVAPRKQAMLQGQLGVLQFNSVLTLSAWT